MSDFHQRMLVLAQYFCARLNILMLTLYSLYHQVITPYKKEPQLRGSGYCECSGPWQVSQKSFVFQVSIEIFDFQKNLCLNFLTY